MNKRHPIALITGASRGIGKATATVFADKGYDLILICKKSSDLLEQSINDLKKRSVHCIGYLCDVKDYTEAQAICHKAVSEIGVPDVIINNAGIAHIGLLTDMTPGQWDEIIGTNLTGIFNICHAFLPHMIRRQSGKIINVSSVWGNVGASCEAAYSASKGGVNSFSKALAKELAPSHISVNALACGIIDTEMNQFLSPEERSAIIDEIPACRLGTSEEVAQMLFLLAQAPEYLTGQVITMDGGWT